MFVKSSRVEQRVQSKDVQFEQDSCFFLKFLLGHSLSYELEVLDPRSQKRWMWVRSSDLSLILYCYLPISRYPGPASINLDRREYLLALSNNKSTKIFKW